LGLEALRQQGEGRGAPAEKNGAAQGKAENLPLRRKKSSAPLDWDAWGERRRPILSYGEMGKQGKSFFGGEKCTNRDFNTKKKKKEFDRSTDQGRVTGTDQ